LNDSSSSRVDRLLFLLPYLSTQEKVQLDEVASDLGVTSGDVLADLSIACDVSLDANGLDSPGELDVEVTPDGDVRVVGTVLEPRPVRLTLPEAVTLARAVRVLVEQDAASKVIARQLLRRFLGVVLGSLFRARPVLREGDVAVESPVRPNPGVQTVLEDTILRQVAVTIRHIDRYTGDTKERIIHPYRLVCLRGVWYVVGYCTLREAVRIFRVDAILDAGCEDEAFQVPADFVLEDYVDDSAFVKSSPTFSATVRYSTKIARWIAEQRPDAKHNADGSIDVECNVAAVDWLVRLVLLHGEDAVVIEPEWVRERVAERMRKYLATVPCKKANL
jgi:predicted DNA-binding transcriptional regulator YafY